MLVVKDYHHLWMHAAASARTACCHAHHTRDAICVLDGMPIHEHKQHSHNSIVPQDTEGDDCAICHYSIAKILQPGYTHCGWVAASLGTLPPRDSRSPLNTFPDHCPGRAPPMDGDFVALKG